ncbi:hypothetical protein JIQ42_01249 [Leishmania sp. Namibia]|uniref:hypothetical protein n=1 Tax=Leishmania sp. Namibia TaxID=2802991 RepID=UPI001B69482C|nr:hypothetical protein JIQ42_01249 [Leishmania sp. Namibia]
MAFSTQPAKWDARYVNPNHPHDSTYYMKCIGGGILACGTTHPPLCPLDVVKCNMQVRPEHYKSLGSGLKKVIREEGCGAKGLMKGWLPILMGYSAQGAFKFGLYEYFKDFYANMVGRENAKKYEGIIWLAGSASAEFFADMGLCPFEMIKVKVQTSPKGTFPTGMLAAMSAMRADPSSGFPYKSLVPLWGRQIPYTMAKFFFFEKVVRLFYQYVFTKPKEQYNKTTQLSITFASAEFFADMGLCPFEMIKVKVQTSPKGTFPTGMLAAMSAMRADPSSGFPYKSLVPLWGRQIPYTMAKFFFFEKVVRLFYQYVFTKPKEQYNKATQLSITFASGYIAGVICAIVSHPADTLVSARGKASNAGKSYGQIAKGMGYMNVCTKGLGTRILMIGTLTGLQWWIYDTYKTALGMGTSGGSGKK